MIPEGTTQAELEKQEQQHHNFDQPLRVILTSPKTPLSHLARFFFLLLPTWIQSYLIPPTERRRRQLRKTSFLDGLRGVAALLVVILHHMGPKKYWYLKPFTFGPYDEGEDPQDYTSPLQLPIIRLLYSPEGMVPIFFYISGYVLSFRAIQIIHGTKKEDLLDSLSSSIFRRGFRLFLPSIAGIALMEAGAAIGMHQFGHPAPGLWGYVLDFFSYVTRFFDAMWGWDVADDNLMQFWTIPVEFVCSMVLFIVIIGTASLYAPLRIALIFGIMQFVMKSGHHWGIFCFLGGFLIAEVEELMVEHSKAGDPRAYSDEEHELLDPNKNVLQGMQRTWSNAPTRITRALLYNVFWGTALLFSMIILGSPVKNIEMDPLLSWAKRDYGWIELNLWAAFLYINCLFRFPWLQKIYTTRIALYLGDISYSMYIVHYYLVLYWSPIFQKMADKVFGEQRKGHFNRALGNAFEMAPLLFIVIWQADIFWRVVDIPSVKFAKWVESKCRRPRE